MGMGKLIEHKFLIRRHLLTIIGMTLCSYFSYHIAFGERSYWRLRNVETSIASLSAEYEQLHARRAAVEAKVVRLRSSSLDPDLLEERARYVLGYVRPDETVIIR